MLSTYTNNEVNAAPIKASPIILVIVKEDPVTASPITMNKTAPEFTPNTDGEASGFLVSTCMIVPATARLAPTTTAIKVRGTRVLSKIRCSLEPSKWR
ncbi:hypothetical protein D1872_292720 [compost metagenome]